MADVVDSGGSFDTEIREKLENRRNRISFLGKISRRADLLNDGQRWIKSIKPASSIDIQ